MSETDTGKILSIFPHTMCSKSDAEGRPTMLYEACAFSASLISHFVKPLGLLFMVWKNITSRFFPLEFQL